MRKETPANGQRGSALVVALLVMVLLSLLGAAMLSMSEVETLIAANDQWAEGAFYAAEAAVQVAVDRIDDSPAASTRPVDLTEMGDGYSYRSGGRREDAPQPLEHVGTFPAVGYTVGTANGYGATGYVLDVYQINTTGLGPRNATQEIEVQAQYGPVPR